MPSTLQGEGATAVTLTGPQQEILSLAAVKTSKVHCVVTGLQAMSARNSFGARLMSTNAIPLDSTTRAAGSKRVYVPRYSHMRNATHFSKHGSWVSMMVMRICSMATDPGRHGAMTPNAVGIGVAVAGTAASLSGM